jgi:hypothetical protein
MLWLTKSLLSNVIVEFIGQASSPQPAANRLDRIGSAVLSDPRGDSPRGIPCEFGVVQMKHHFRGLVRQLFACQREYNEIVLQFPAIVFAGLDMTIDPKTKLRDMDHHGLLHVSGSWMECSAHRICAFDSDF